MLSGTPTAGGVFNLTATARDATNYSGAAGYKLVVCAPITITPGTLPGVNRGAAYSQSFTASGGTAPYSFAVTGGALPAGLNLSSGGQLTGAPTASGTFAFTITATDANGCSSGVPYTLIVNSPSRRVRR